MSEAARDARRDDAAGGPAVPPGDAAFPDGPAGDAGRAGPAEQDAAVAAAEAWLASRGRRAFEFQKEAWRASLAGESGLIEAPTGTGKTLAAWLGPVLGASLELRRGGGAPPPPAASRTRVLWITPLRALANDLVQNLREPLAALGVPWRVEQRTGDTGQAMRTRQREKPPEALVITPESVAVLLSHAASHEQLRSVEHVVVDEWHELLGGKRGVLLELCLARLRALNPALRTWGLSATLPNQDEALAALLGPRHRGRLVRAGLDKPIEVAAVLPRDISRFPWAGHLGAQLVGPVVEAIERAGTTLVFANTRSQAELWYQAIVEARLDWLTTVALHHGSLDRRLRTRIEDGLRAGSLRCVVCTSSLDLGVDFAPVDQVIQVGSPKGVARLVQRAGRSGHRPGGASRILCVPTHAWELVEIAAAREAARAGRIEPRRPLQRSLDVLVQHAVTLATGPGFDEEELLAEVRGTHAFAALTDAEWRWVVDFITRGGTALQGYPQYRRVVRSDGRLRIADGTLARRHRMSIGTIASDTEMLVKWMGGRTLGTIEESFVGRLRPGDTFIFSGRALQLVQVKDMTAYVRASKSRRGPVARWQGGRMPLSHELAASVLDVLGAAEHAPRAPEIEAAAPVLRLQSRWSRLPDRATLLVERLRSREGHHLFVYPFAGRLANEGLAVLVATRWARGEPRTLSIAANDYGFELLSRVPLAADAARIRELLSPDRLAEDLIAGVNLSEIARRQFRDIARIAGLVFQGFPGASKPARQLQASSGLVFEVLEQYDPENLLLGQSRAEVLEAQLEISRIAAALAQVAGRRVVIQDLRRLTPLAFPLWASRLQAQMISTESWQERIERAARELEAAALREGDAP